MDKAPLLGAARTRVLQQLARGPGTAITIALALGIQVSAARKHLERLKALGIVDERFERVGPGRPKKFYALTEEGRELSPRRYDMVLNALLAELVRDRGEAPAERLFHRIAEDVARRANPEPKADRAGLGRLVEGLEEMGFQPSLAVHGKECTVTSHNCPILRTAKAHRELVCRGLHGEILRRATGAPEVLRGKWIVDDDPVCMHVIRRE